MPDAYTDLTVTPGDPVIMLDQRRFATDKARGRGGVTTVRINLDDVNEATAARRPFDPRGGRHGVQARCNGGGIANVTIVQAL